MTSHTTAIIFDNGTFFCAYLDNGRVRVGMNGIKCFDIKADHPQYKLAVSAKTENDVEAIFDTLMDTCWDE